MTQQDEGSLRSQASGGVAGLRERVAAAMCEAYNEAHASSTKDAAITEEFAAEADAVLAVVAPEMERRDAEIERLTRELSAWRSGARRRTWPRIEAAPDGITYAAHLVRAQGTEGGDEHDQLLREASQRLKALHDAASTLLQERDVLAWLHAEAVWQRDVVRREIAEAWEDARTAQTTAYNYAKTIDCMQDENAALSGLLRGMARRASKLRRDAHWAQLRDRVVANQLRAEIAALVAERDSLRGRLANSAALNQRLDDDNTALRAQLAALTTELREQCDDWDDEHGACAQSVPDPACRIRAIVDRHAAPVSESVPATPPDFGCVRIDLVSNWKRGDKALWKPAPDEVGTECEVVGVAGDTVLVEADEFPFGNPHRWAADVSELSPLPAPEPRCAETVPDGHESAYECGADVAPGSERCAGHTRPAPLPEASSEASQEEDPSSVGSASTPPAADDEDPPDEAFRGSVDHDLAAFTAPVTRRAAPPAAGEADTTPRQPVRYLASNCHRCQHTYNWHASTNQCAACGCGGFVDEPEVLPNTEQEAEK